MIFAPNIPVIYDSVGNFITYLNDELFEEARNFKLKIMFGSDYMIEEKMIKSIEKSN